MKPLPAAPSGVTAGGVDLLNIPLLFIENRGQADPEARFYAKAQGYTLWITPGGMVFDVVRREPDDGRGVAPPDVREMMGRERKPAARGVARLRFVGAHPSPEIVSEEAAALSVNVFRGSDPSRWGGGIPTSRAVRYKDLYPGIDLKVYGVGKQIEYDWIVAPGADPGRIRFSYGDAADARIDENGDLRVRTDAGDLVHRRPVTYQEIGGKRVAVVSAFRETAENICGFSVGDYDSRYPLVIDPVVLAYGTCLGGGGADIGWEVAVADDSGVVYVAGRTSSADFPVRDGFQEKPAGGRDHFIAKIDTTKRGAESLLWCSYLGGSGNEGAEYYECATLAADGAGHVYVAFYTDSSDFPTTPNAFQRAGHPGYDVVVAKMDTNIAGPASLVYATYLGGNGNDRTGFHGTSIAVDDKGIIHIAGSTYSTDFPTTPDAFRTTKNGPMAAFIVKLDPSGNGPSDLLYGTYLGGNKYDALDALVLDGRGRAWVTGGTCSPDFPVRGGFQSTPHGKDDAFVACIDTTEKGDAALVWSSYLGGSENDWGNWIPSDGTGRLYLSGGTESPDFPVTGGFQTALHGNRDGFVACLENTGELVWSSYLGGRSDDEVHGIALDGAGCIYVTGYTFSPDFPTRHAFQTKHPSESSKQDSEPDYWERDMDAFLVKLVPGAELTVGKAGTGKGRVTSDPPGIDCGTDCSEAYPYGMKVTLTAVPEEGFVAAWEGAGAGSKENSLTVTMDGPKTVTVRFDLVEYDLAVEKSGAGRGKVTSDPPGIDCGTDCSEAYPFGTEVTLTAVPGEGSVAVWEGAGAGSKENSLTVTVDGPKTVAVRFDLVEYDLAVEKSGAGRGKVTSDPPGIDCGTDCSETYPYGTVVTLTAVPEESSLFEGWTGACTGHTCTVVMTDNQRVHAVFTERASVRPVIDYVVPATAVSGGPGFTLEVHGGMFRENAAVYWNGSPRKTEFVSAQQLKAEILPEDITAAGAMPVTVVNKTEIGASVESESMEFIVMDPRAIPTLDEYGMILLAVLLTGAALVLLRRRREGRGAPR